MIKIVAKRVIRSECIDVFHQLAAELVASSQAEAGNISYTFNQSTTDPRVHVFLEEWQDQAAIDFHNQTEPFTRIVPQFDELTEGQCTVEHYTEV